MMSRASFMGCCYRGSWPTPLGIPGPLEHLSPLGWEHINLTGDYVWRQNRRVESGKFRPLRPVPVP